MSTENAREYVAGNERSMKIAFALTATFLVVEIIGGVLTKSLALISDAAHMLTDTTALGIALVAISIAKRPADKKRTFGYYRFEILAASFNALLLFGVAAYIIYEAYFRLKAPPQIESTGMLFVAACGLVINLISIRLLSARQGTSLNVRGAYLEVWSDLIGSIGVIAGAILIRFTEWAWIDSAIAVLIGLWVLPRTWILLKSSLNILLEGVPDDVDLDKVGASIVQVPGVLSFHDLHVWALTSGKVSLSMHVVYDPKINTSAEILPILQTVLSKEFGISHMTIQFELVPCSPSAEMNFI